MKSKFEIEIEIRSQKLIKTEIKIKLNLIYDSKYKSNTRWWKIRIKTRNLTRSHARNDPINHWIQGFSLRDFRNEVRRSRLISSDSFHPILIFNLPLTRKWAEEERSSAFKIDFFWFFPPNLDLPLTRKWVQKRKNLRDSRTVVSRQFELLKNPRMVFRREEHFNLWAKLGITVRCVDSSSINGWD